MPGIRDCLQVALRFQAKACIQARGAWTYGAYSVNEELGVTNRP